MAMPVLLSAIFMSKGVKELFSWVSKAAAAATWGVAIDVPDNDLNPEAALFVPPDLKTVETMETPGARIVLKGALL